MTIFLIILIVVVFIGIIRVISRPSESFGDFILDLFLLDYLGDLFDWLINAFLEAWD